MGDHEQEQEQDQEQKQEQDTDTEWQKSDHEQRRWFSEDAGFVLINAIGHCYVKRTVFETPEKEMKPAHLLKVGDQILGSVGQRLSVSYLRLHQKQSCRLVTMRTAQAELTVTFDHRIVVPNSDGTEKLARELAVGDTVLCGSRPQKLTKLIQYETKAELVEIRFSPDEPVETRMACRYGILTKGQRMPIVVRALGRLGPYKFEETETQEPNRRARSA